MTAPLASYAPEDVETALVAHLVPLRPDATKNYTGIERKAGDGLPFRLINMITGAESAEMGTADQVVSVHTLCERPTNGSLTAARDESLRTHRRMLLLNRQPQITVGARVVAVQYVEVVEPPRWEFYSDNILRKVARYRVGLPYVAA